MESLEMRGRQNLTKYSSSVKGLSQDNNASIL